MVLRFTAGAESVHTLCPKLEQAGAVIPTHFRDGQTEAQSEHTGWGRIEKFRARLSGWGSHAGAGCPLLQVEQGSSRAVPAPSPHPAPVVPAMGPRPGPDLHQRPMTKRPFSALSGLGRLHTLTQWLFRMSWGPVSQESVTKRVSLTRASGFLLAEQLLYAPPNTHTHTLPGKLGQGDKHLGGVNRSGVSMERWGVGLPGLGASPVAGELTQRPVADMPLLRSQPTLTRETGRALSESLSWPV